jgi:hypothetical protein
MRVLYSAPGLEEPWQIHFSLLSGQEHAPGVFISNTMDDQPAASPIEATTAPPAGARAPPRRHNRMAFRSRSARALRVVHGDQRAKRIHESIRRGIAAGAQMAQIASDLAVTLPEDRPGMLARAVQAVSSSGINLEGHAEMEGVVHVLTSDAPATKAALESAGFRVLKEQQVVLVEVEDRPGSAASIFRRIADAKVNIRFSYLATRNRLVIAADDLQSLMTALSA